MTAQDVIQLGRTSRPRTVLIASSLEKDSNSVVGTGAAVARAAGAKVYLVHVAPPEPFAVGLETGWLAPGAFKEEAERRRRLLWDQAKRLRIDPDELAGVGVTSGPPHWVIVETARRIGAELIVVGASEFGRSLAKLLGSTADRVVRKASCPVLVVRGELPVPPRRVLMPVDLSELSADSFRCGLDLLGQISNGAQAEIEAFYALDFLPPLEFCHPDMPWVTTSQQVERRAAWELERFVIENGEDAPAAMHAKVQPGDARNEILSELERKSADLVILGTHGRNGFDRLLLGSIASSVLRQAPCSVLMIPPAATLGRAIAEAVVAQAVPNWHVEHPALARS
ncbi:MAG TPA: universal stress protein [Thermoanaerobaculia bacterium]